MQQQHSHKDIKIAYFYPRDIPDEIQKITKRPSKLSLRSSSKEKEIHRQKFRKQNQNEVLDSVNAWLIHNNYKFVSIETIVSYVGEITMSQFFEGFRVFYKVPKPKIVSK